MKRSSRPTWQAVTLAGFAARSNRCSKPRPSRRARCRVWWPHWKDGLEAWRTRSLADLDVIYVYLDGFVLRVRSAGKVVSVPVLGVIGVFPDGHKHLLALDLCGGESFAAWKGCLDDLVARGLRAPVLAIIDGNAGLRRAVGLVWLRTAVQRCCVHKLRNLTRKAPKHALDEIRDDFHRIVYAASADAARAAYTAFERAWSKRCQGVVTSLQEAARSCSHSSPSPELNGRRCEPRTRLNGS